MTNHAVRRVDRLVGGGAGKAADCEPQCGRHHTVGEIFCQALDRRPCDSRLVEGLHVPADNVGNGLATGREALLFERCRNALAARRPARVIGSRFKVASKKPIRRPVHVTG